MKTTILFFLEFVFILPLFSQANVITEIEETYNHEKTIWEKSKKIAYEYNAQNLLTKRTFFNPDASNFDWIWRSESNYTYNAQGFLIKERREHSSNNSLTNRTITEINWHLNANNQPDSIENRIIRAHLLNGDILIKTYFQYDEENRVTNIKKFIASEINGINNFILEEEQIKKYDDSGCLIREINFELKPNGQYSAENFTYKYYDNCLLKTEIRGTSNNVPPDTTFERFQKHYFYYQIGGMKIDSIIREEKLQPTDSWTPYLTTIRQTAENNNQIFVEERYTAGFAARAISEFNENGERILHQYWEQPASHLDFILIAEEQFNFEYDSQEFLIKKRGLINDFDVISNVTWRYQNYCDGLPQIIYYENFSTSITNQRTILEYDTPPNCHEDEKNKSINISPNPANQKIIVENAVLGETGAKITITDLSGKTLFQEKMPPRTNRLELDVSFLGNGLYILLLENERFHASEKFVVQKP